MARPKNRTLLAVVILDEFVKELAALCLEHSVLVKVPHTPLAAVSPAAGSEIAGPDSVSLESFPPYDLEKKRGGRLGRRGSNASDVDAGSYIEIYVDLCHYDRA